MAIFYPKLFCEVGQRLILRKDIKFEGLVLHKGEECIVEDIVGYGFNLKHESNFDFRIMNSSMSEFFETPETSVKLINSKFTQGDLSFLPAYIVTTKNVIQNFDFFDIVMFNKRFEIKGVVEIEPGTRFFIKEENGHFNLFDVDTHEKVLNLSQSEIDKYCQIEHANKEEFV